VLKTTGTLFTLSPKIISTKKPTVDCNSLPSLLLTGIAISIEDWAVYLYSKIA
jgi:hypothetical protein